MGESTDVASTNRGVLGDLRDCVDSPELLRFGAGVTSTTGIFLAPLLIAALSLWVYVD